VNPTSAGNSQEVLCDELLARYGDYLDGLLTPVQVARLQLHIETCAACGRYDRIMQRGLELVRDLPPVEPSPDFEQRLQHRLYHVDDAAALVAQRPAAGAMATFAVAGVLALLAWSPVLLSTRDGAAVSVVPATVPVDGAPPTRVAEARPAPQARELPELPRHTPLLLSGVDPWQAALDGSPLVTGAMSRIVAAFPGPYSPLVVTPPVHGRTVRTISAEYID
jgi:hypothetical protein